MEGRSFAEQVAAAELWVALTHEKQAGKRIDEVLEAVKEVLTKRTEKDHLRAWSRHAALNAGMAKAQLVQALTGKNYKGAPVKRMDEAMDAAHSLTFAALPPTHHTTAQMRGMLEDGGHMDYFRYGADPSPDAVAPMRKKASISAKAVRSLFSSAIKEQAGNVETGTWYHGSPHKLTTLRKGSYVTPYKEDALSFAAPWGTSDLVFKGNGTGRPPLKLKFKDGKTPPKDHPIYVYEVRGAATPAKTNMGGSYEWNHIIVEDAPAKLVQTEASWQSALLEKNANSRLRAATKVTQVGEDMWHMHVNNKLVGRMATNGSQIQGVKIDPSHQGMGLGKKFYGEVARRMPNQTIHSDSQVSPAATRVWNSMKRTKGAKVTLAPWAEQAPTPQGQIGTNWTMPWDAGYNPANDVLRDNSGFSRPPSYTATLPAQSAIPAPVVTPTVGGIPKTAAIPGLTKEKRKAIQRADALFREDDKHKKWDDFMDNVGRKSFAHAVQADPRADDKLRQHADSMNRLKTGKTVGKVGEYRIIQLRGGGLGCTCGDWRYVRSVAPEAQRACKHIREFEAKG